MAADELVPAASRFSGMMGQELNGMIILGIIVLLLGGYLVYALAHPERF